uniref:MYND-type domain-containing protein n=1 Tax=Mycena chlorophos TaxID=658473 RepID=A0ABQ0L7S7_MYCCL|nr:predicted protein [Mycena chlorophos]
MSRVTLISRWTARCTNCGAQNPRLKCSACRISRYCNNKCQREDWQWHKDACKEHKESLEKIEDTNLAACVEFFSRYTDEWQLPFAQWGLFSTNLASRNATFLKQNFFALLLEETKDLTKFTRRSAFNVAVSGMFPNASFEELIPAAKYSADGVHAEFLRDFEKLDKSPQVLRIVLMSSIVCTVFSVNIKEIFPPHTMGWTRSPSASQYFKDIYEKEFKDAVAAGHVRTALNRVMELFTFITTGEVLDLPGGGESEDAAAKERI